MSELCINQFHSLMFVMEVAICVVYGCMCASMEAQANLFVSAGCLNCGAAGKIPPPILFFSEIN
jgi:hypothetical protein